MIKIIHNYGLNEGLIFYWLNWLNYGIYSKWFND